MIDVLLVVVGVGLVVLGVAHVGLPRWLGWTADRLQDAGPLSALVVRMHVYFLGLFLVLLGGLTVLVAAGPPTTLARAVCLGAAVIFAVRAVCEVVWVGRAVLPGPSTLRALHRAALVLWPALVVVYAVAAYTT